MSARNIPLTVVNQPARPVAIDISDDRKSGNAEPVSPTSGEKHTELSAVHDFAGKFRHPELLSRLKAYVQARSELRRAVEEGHAPPPSRHCPTPRRCRSTWISRPVATTRVTTASTWTS